MSRKPPVTTFKKPLVVDDDLDIEIEEPDDEPSRAAAPPPAPKPEPIAFRVVAFTGFSAQNGTGRHDPKHQLPGEDRARFGVYPAPGGQIATLTLGQVVTLRAHGLDAIKRMRGAGVKLEPVAQ